jgi:CBS domain-containing protein
VKAADIMTSEVITASPDDSVLSVVEKMLQHRISAVPVVDENDRVLGIISEGDLISRPENETARDHSWWLDLIMGPRDEAVDFLRTHGTRAADVMTTSVVTAQESDTAADIARKLERHHIKRVPVIRDGRLVGIVSRANLLRSFATGAIRQTESENNGEIRTAIVNRLKEAGLLTHLIDVTVGDETVELWGLVSSRTQAEAARAAVEGVAPSKRIENHLTVRAPGYSPM